MLNEYKPILNNKRFRLLWTSQIFSQLTINIMNFIFLIKLFEATGSAISTSFLWVAYALPAILIGPIASSVVDTVNRRKILVITNFLQAITIFLYALFHGTSIFLIYEVVFIYSLLNQFYVPSEAASLPSLVAKNKLPQGNSLFFLTQQASLVLGFAIAGPLNHIFGFEKTLFVCSFFLFAAFLSTYYLPSLPAGKVLPGTWEKAIASFFAKIAEGYNFIKKERRILSPFLLLLGFQVAVQVVTVQVPVIASDIIRIPLNTAGLYLLVPAAIGALVGAMFLPKLIKKGWRKKAIIENSLLTLSIFILVLCFILPLFKPVLKGILSFLTLALMGFSFVSVIVPSQTFMQEWTPAELRGRVFGNFWFLVTVASVFPVVFSGTVIEILGIKMLLTILAIGTFLVFIFSKRWGDRFIAKDTDEK